MVRKNDLFIQPSSVALSLRMRSVHPRSRARQKERAHLDADYWETRAAPPAICSSRSRARSLVRCALCTRKNWILGGATVTFLFPCVVPRRFRVDLRRPARFDDGLTLHGCLIISPSAARCRVQADAARVAELLSDGGEFDDGRRDWLGLHQFRCGSACAMCTSAPSAASAVRPRSGIHREARQAEIVTIASLSSCFLEHQYGNDG